MYRFSPVQEQNGVKIFVQNAGNFKEIEQAFWSARYNAEKIDKGSLEEDNLAFHDHFLNPMRSLPAGSLVLEIGCGTRGDGIMVAQSGKKVFESDISLTAVLKARERARLAGTESMQEFIVCDAENLPFVDNTFDAVFIAASLHHLPDTRKGLSEMKRVVKPGGYVVIAVEPNTWPYYSIFLFLAPIKWLIRKMQKRKLNSIADDTTVGFSKRKLKKLLREAGIEIIDIRPVKFFLEYYDSGLRLLGRFSARQKKPNIKIQRAILKFDDFLGRIPGIRNFPWHWNVIARKPKT